MIPFAHVVAPLWLVPYIALLLVHMIVRIFVKQDEDGIFVSEVPELPGCISQGNTREEAITNIKDAVSGYMASLKKHNEPSPFVTDEEPIEIHV